MRRGSILVLVLEIVLIMGMLVMSFLRIIEDEVVYFSQINPCCGSELKKDSALSIAIANLSLHVSGEFNFDECVQRIERCIGDDLGPNVHVSLVPEDNKIPLKLEFLPLLEQLFASMGFDCGDAKSLTCELDELLGVQKCNLSKIDRLLDLPAFGRMFTDGNGLPTERWQIFAKNATCQGTDAVALRGLSGELLQAICSLEGWQFYDAKAALESSPILGEISRNSIFAELYSRGCSIHHPGLFREENSCFSLTIAIEADGAKFSESYIIKHNPFCDWYGFPFEVVSKGDKL